MNHIFYAGLFETKGIEYIIVIAFLIVLVPFWMYISNSKKAVQNISRAIDNLSQRIMNLPQGIYFSKNHTWAFLEKSGLAKVGLNDFLASVFGEVNIHLLKHPGDEVKKGEPIAELQQGDKRLIINSSVSGTVVNTNGRISETPGLVSSNTYEAGWLYEVKPVQWKAETNAFVLGNNATTWLLDEVARFKDFLAISLARQNAEPELIALQEGGELRNEIMDDMDGDIWMAFQKSFLE
jgi:glycine cleavage system H protein